MAEDKDRESEAYLARVRRTIEESNRLVEQVGLRIRETDRMLEQRGLTREQVMAMKFSDAQLEAVNDELKRRGLDPLEKWTMDGLETPGEDPLFRGGDTSSVGVGMSDSELENRQRKFGMMMKPFQI